MTDLPEGYTTRGPARGDAEEVAALIAACQISDTGASDMTLEEMLDDWQELDLAEEAVVVAAPDGRISGYADVYNRSFVTVSVYGYVHPDHRNRGIGAFLIAWGERWTRDRMPHAPANARVVVQHYIGAVNAGAHRLLESAGYAPVRRVYVMETELDEAPPRRAGPTAYPSAPSSPNRTSARPTRLSRTPSGTCGDARGAPSSASC